MTATELPTPGLRSGTELVPAEVAPVDVYRWSSPSGPGRSQVSASSA